MEVRRDVIGDVRHCAEGCPYEVTMQWEILMTCQEVFLGCPLGCLPGHPLHCGCSKHYHAIYIVEVVDEFPHITL